MRRTCDNEPDDDVRDSVRGEASGVAADIWRRLMLVDDRLDGRMSGSDLSFFVELVPLTERNWLPLREFDEDDDGRFSDEWNLPPVLPLYCLMFM